MTFTVAVNEDASIASGRLVVRRVFDTEYLEWQFESPDLAKGEVFETGVNLISKDTELAKCINEVCSIHSQALRGHESRPHFIGWSRNAGL